MIYSKLRKLEQQKRDIQSLIIAAYQSSADPEIVVYRVNELSIDLDTVDEEIQMEETFVRFKQGLVFFVASALLLLIVGLFKKLL
jgi:hypothetical protein